MRRLVFISLLLLGAWPALAHVREERFFSNTNNVVRRLAYGRVNMQPGYAQLGIALNGRPVPFLTLANSNTNWPTRWQAQLLRTFLAS